MVTRLKVDGALDLDFGTNGWLQASEKAGAVVLVTHDEGAVAALQPDRVLLLPDGDEDLWSPEYAELISLA